MNLCKMKAIKLIEDNPGENLGDLSLADDFFRYNTKSMIHERKIGKVDFKIKNFYSVKDPVKIKAKNWNQLKYSLTEEWKAKL